MTYIPLAKNSVALTTIAVVAAVGIVVRFLVQIPVVPGVLVLTPGFIFSLLGGVIGGIPGGILVGAVVGMSGALSGTEIPILPMIGNICLGIGGGYAIHVVERDTLKYYVMVILGGGIIGGFIPTMTIFASFVDPFVVNLTVALIDMLQALLWAVVALTIEKFVIRPIVGEYLYKNHQTQELALEGASI